MAISVTIEPETADIVQGRIRPAHAQWKTQRFTATVKDDPGNAGVIWAIAQGGGMMSEDGVYSPPPSWPHSGKATISATSKTDKTKSATATVTYQE